MSARSIPVALLLAGLGALAACSGGIGGSPSTTQEPFSAQDMCTQGDATFARLDELDRTKPDFVPKLKEVVEGFADRAPEEIHADLKAWVDYIQEVSDPGQLDPLPADLQVSTQRVDDWWQKNCKKSFGS
jgi:hypothetical protein